MVAIGQKLYDERLRQGLTLESVSKATKIRVSFLSAIEKSDYTKLPQGAYAQGFVKNYAEFLGLPKREILAIFRREFNEEKNFKVLPEEFIKKKAFPVHRIRIQQTLIVAVLVLFLIAGYILYQYRSAFITPSVQVFSPKENTTVSQTITIIGKTDPNTTVYINNDLITVLDNGEFKKNIDSFPGKTTLKIRAVNRFGKETIVERHLEVTP